MLVELTSSLLGRSICSACEGASGRDAEWILSHLSIAVCVAIARIGMHLRRPLAMSRNGAKLRRPLITDLLPIAHLMPPTGARAAARRRSPISMPTAQQTNPTLITFIQIPSGYSVARRTASCPLHKYQPLHLTRSLTPPHVPGVEGGEDVSTSSGQMSIQSSELSSSRSTPLLFLKKETNHVQNTFI